MPKERKLRREEIEAFRAQIWAFYSACGRHDLPWRVTKDPYKILVSEVMLQQTQVARVEEKFPKFLWKFPTVGELAKAPLKEVLAVWAGMGYNRRALALKRCAEKIVAEHRGKVPRGRDELEALPGIGPYTAGAIRAFAFDEPEVFIETNIRRVFIHQFFGNQEGIGDKEILPLVEATLDRGQPREWYWALMDYGAELPKVVRKNPNVQSRHYVKQSTFKGSLREVRGKIVRVLSEGSGTLVAIRRACEGDARTKEALDALTKDGLVYYEKRKYQLA
ncbi:MAG: A/G-specific adenine glycosylase [Patescibacteria group bacterium]